MSTIVFDKERILGFSDAVFSIAMTLLVLEVSIPTYRSVNEYGTWGVLADRIPNFIGFVVSFFVSAFYWVDYLRITKYVTHFSMKMLWVNIFLLFFVVMLPFSTALYVNGINFVEPFVFYAANLALIALMLFIFIRVVAKQEEGKTGMNKVKRNWESMKMMNTFSIWILAGVLAFVNIHIARAFFILIFVFNPIIDRYYKKRMIREE